MENRKEYVAKAEKLGIRVMARDSISILKKKIEDAGKDEPKEPVEKKKAPAEKNIKVVGDKVVSHSKFKSWEDIYAALAIDLPEKAVERTKGAETGKGYNTTGYKYQYVINRLNEVMGIGGWSNTFEIMNTKDGTTSKGRARVYISVSTSITLRFEGEEVTKTLTGGHDSNTHADALKGAITNSLKKTAALFGVGKAAYEVSIDDDNEPITNNERGVAASKSGYTNQGQGFVAEKQAVAIGAMLGKLGIDVEKFKEKNKYESLYKIPFATGSTIITQLMKKLDAKKKVDAVKEAAPAEDLPSIDYGAEDGGMSDEAAEALLDELD